MKCLRLLVPVLVSAPLTADALPRTAAEFETCVEDEACKNACYDDEACFKRLRAWLDGELERLAQESADIDRRAEEARSGTSRPAPRAEPRPAPEPPKQEKDNRCPAGSTWNDCVDKCWPDNAKKVPAC